MRRVVVTGIGAISPLGNTAKETWENAKKGVNGISVIEQMDTSDLTVHIGGEVKNFDPAEVLGKKEARRIDRYSQLGLVAATEAVKDSGINFEEEDTYRAGVYYSSGIGGLKTIEKETVKGFTKGFERISPFFIPMSIANLLSGHIAIKFGIKGMTTAIVTACASSANAIGDAFRAVKDGYLDVVIAGGAEAGICNLGIAGFNVMKALSTSDDPNNASMPFDINRTGFVMGEGSAALVLEEYDRAIARGAHIYAEVVGYGATCDASHITAPAEGGIGASKCMQAAISEAGIKPEDVDYINAHGTSTPLNDKAETEAIKDAFKDYAYDVSISSTKSMTGHLLGATGAIEALFTIKALEDSFVPPTINLNNPDPECDLDYTPHKGKEKKLTYALTNSLGFGGHNATILFKRFI